MRKPYSWSADLKRLLAEQNDTLVKIVVDDSGETKECGINDPPFAKEFDDGFGGTNGCYFTAWGERYVYFPVCYDGAESIGFVPRNPELRASEHWGGG